MIRIFVKIEVHEHWSQDSDTLLVSCSPKTNSGAIFRGRKNILEELLSFIRANQTVLDNRKELGDLKANLEAILSIVKQYQKQNSLHALRNRIELFCTSVAFSCFFFIMFIFIDVLQRYHHTIEVDRGHAKAFIAGTCSRGYEGYRYDTEGHSEHQQLV